MNKTFPIVMKIHEGILLPSLPFSFSSSSFGRHPSPLPLKSEGGQAIRKRRRRGLGPLFLEETEAAPSLMACCSSPLLPPSAHEIKRMGLGDQYKVGMDGGGSRAQQTITSPTQCIRPLLVTPSTHLLLGGETYKI